MAAVPQDDHIRADVREPIPSPTISSMTSTHDKQDRPLRLAIVGGGIGGLCLALGLRKHSHISVQIYEAAHKFSEIGAGIGVGKNAQRALELLGPDLYAAYKKQATEAPFRICNGQGEGELGSAVLMPPNLRASQSTVHRAQFLDALVELVPGGWAHFDKRLVSIEDKTAEGGSMVLNFKDGTTAEADAIIGADGIHSHTRAHVLDDVPDKEKYKLQYSGAVVYRSVIPMEKVVQALGTDIAQYSSLFMMDGAMMVSYPVDHNERLNAAAYTWEHRTWEKKEWVAPVSREEVLASYRGMQPLDPKINELLNVSCHLSSLSTAGVMLIPCHHSSSNPPPPGQSGTSPTSPNTTAAQSASWATQPTPPAPSTARGPVKPSKTPSLSPTSLQK
jgi:salicylate hydroxylase